MKSRCTLKLLLDWMEFDGKYVEERSFAVASSSSLCDALIRNSVMRKNRNLFLSVKKQKTIFIKCLLYSTKILSTYINPINWRSQKKRLIDVCAITFHYAKLSADTHTKAAVDHFLRIIM